MDKAKLQWHPAFGAALRITLQDEMKYLEVYEEYLLSKKPLQMDILIIKKLKDILPGLPAARVWSAAGRPALSAAGGDSPAVLAKQGGALWEDMSLLRQRNDAGLS